MTTLGPSPYVLPPDIPAGMTCAAYRAAHRAEVEHGPVTSWRGHLRRTSWRGLRRFAPKGGPRV